MGRIKTKQVKRVTIKILREYPDRFKTDFDENKKLLGEIAEIPSKKIRNVIAGYITRLVKNKQST